jgi:phosphoglycolate phosphatase
MFTSIIFDFDGTLVDSRGIALLVYRRLSRKHQLPELTPETLEELKNLPILDRLKVMRYPVYRLPELIREMKQAYREHLPALKPYPGIREVLHTLAGRGYDLHILSSNSRENIAPFLKTHGLEFFSSVKTSPGLFGKHRTLRRLIRKLGLPGRKALYVGDELRDIEACRAAGVPVLAVTWGYDAPALLTRGSPDFMVDRPRAILDLLP